MDVRLRRTWFAPDSSGDISGKYVVKGRVVARGHRLRRGINRNLPDEWLKRLPSDAQVLKKPEEYELEEDEREHASVSEPSLANTDERTEADLLLAQAEHTTRLELEADADYAAQLKATRQANAQKARDAKVAKKKENETDA